MLEVQAVQVFEVCDSVETVTAPCVGHYMCSSHRKQIKREQATHASDPLATAMIGQGQTIT